MDARLILSEIVTNSYQHAGNPPGAPIHVTITEAEERLRIEVLDSSIFDPTPETPQELGSVKWGLRFVEHLADDWGRISEGGMWAELRLSASDTTPRVH